MQRQQVDQGTERRSTEVEDEPQSEEAEREQRKSRAHEQAADHAGRQQEREDGQAAVVEQVAGEQPREDRARAERVVLGSIQVGRDVDVGRLHEERQPHV